MLVATTWTKTATHNQRSPPLTRKDLPPKLCSGSLSSTSARIPLMPALTLFLPQQLAKPALKPMVLEPALKTWP